MSGNSRLKQTPVYYDTPDGCQSYLAHGNNELTQLLTLGGHCYQVAHANSCLEGWLHRLHCFAEPAFREKRDIDRNCPCTFLHVEAGAEGEQLDSGDGETDLVLDQGGPHLLQPLLGYQTTIPSHEPGQAALVHQFEMVSDRPLAQLDAVVFKTASDN